MIKILLTGSSGFIGTPLKKALIGNYCEVIEYDILIERDVLNLIQLESYIKEVDLVYHTAVQSDLPNMLSNIDNAFNGVNFNIISTHNVVYLCAKYNKKLIFSSSESVYGDSLSNLNQINEDSMLSPNNLYGLSKYIGENIIKEYSRKENFNLEYVILRYGSVYGLNARLTTSLGLTIDKALKNEHIIIYGDGSQKRTCVYLEDLIDCCVKTLQQFEHIKNNIFNVCYMEKISQLQIIQDIKRISNSKSEIIFTKQCGHRKLTLGGAVISNKKTCVALNWHPQYSWIDGITKTIKLYKDNLVK